MFLGRPLTPSAMDDRSPYGDFWFEPVSVRSQAGVRVNADAAMRLSAVFACVRVLSETFACLPFQLYRRDGAVATPVTDHWLVKLMRRPNEFQNGFEWREMMTCHLSLRGNGYNRVKCNARGEIIRALPIHPDRVKMEMLTSGDYRYRIKQPGGADEILGRDEIWHIRGMSSDGITGMSVIEIARETIGLGLAAQEYGARFFANDARPGGGWIEFPGQFKDQSARTMFRETWQAFQGGRNRHKTAVLEHGMKYHELGVKNNDAQFLETRKFQVTDIARLFRVPPHLIGDLDRSTNNNIEQQSLEFVTYTMTPWAERWEAALEADFLLEDEGLEVEFCFENMLRGDQAARSEFYSSGITNGWLTRNEARQRENLNPIEGLDEPLIPLNMQTEEQAEATHQATLQKATQPATPPEPDPDAETEDTSPANARLVAIARSAAERVARRESEVVVKARDPRHMRAVYAEHAEFVAGALGVTLAAATEYCETRADQHVPGATKTEIHTLAVSVLERLALTGSSK